MDKQRTHKHKPTTTYNRVVQFSFNWKKSIFHPTHTGLYEYLDRLNEHLFDHSYENLYEHSYKHSYEQLDKKFIWTFI